ncbi:Na+/H+ antiporter subunit E [Rugosimonospora africana]|uniref:Na+/H+ antiporter subunit E n=1 Tax=Rugosimonospora africana TaxID=556532 RepID=UPI001941CA4A|nr:Na+/H+ antiporter subunit E [Rugosimonospora africana]
MARWWALFWWAYLVWTILSWTLSVEQIVVGAVLSALTALVCARLGPVAGPWTLLRPRRVAGLARLAGVVVVRVVRANVALTRRIWSPRIPLRSGMIVVPTRVTGDGTLTAVGLFTSVIVDSQLVDIDRRRHELQYHGVWIDSAEARANRDRINGPIEDRLRWAGLR